jgi:hypothetical protein
MRHAAGRSGRSAIASSYSRRTPLWRPQTRGSTRRVESSGGRQEWDAAPLRLLCPLARHLEKELAIFGIIRQVGRSHALSCVVLGHLPQLGTGRHLSLPVGRMDDSCRTIRRIYSGRKSPVCDGHHNATQWITMPREYSSSRQEDALRAAAAHCLRTI